MAAICPSCGFENPASFKFCGQCGAKFDLRNASSDSLTMPPPTSVETIDGNTAERRQLTVMFCDLVDSTQLSDHLDPEDLREVIHHYQKACGEIVSRYDGHIAQFLGDGLLVYFGFPHAHEDDVRRAAISGLEMVDAIKALNRVFTLPANYKLAVRIGINTGLVVTSELGSGQKKEHLALGKTPNVAARLQSLARADQILVSEDSYQLIQNDFNFKSLGELHIKGLADTIKAYRVIESIDNKNNIIEASGKTRSKMIGREHEVKRLINFWNKTDAGKGCVSVVNGDAGIGKSRLLKACREEFNSDEFQLVVARCHAFGESSTFSPIIELLQRIIGLSSSLSVEDKRKKLFGFLEHEKVDLEEAFPLFATFLGLPLSARDREVVMTPQKRKARMIELVTDILISSSEQLPVLLIIEDLHWVDPSTLELINHLVKVIPQHAIYAIFTCRPLFEIPWKESASLQIIHVDNLEPIDIKTMVLSLTQNKALPEEIIEHIVNKTDGIPLFIEELTKMLVESGLVRFVGNKYVLDGELPENAIPTTLQDSLTARLDSLGSAKEVAQLGAALGREFSYNLLRSVIQKGQDELDMALQELVDAEMLYRRGLPPNAEFIFKHALIQNAAASSLLKSHRQKLHQRIATVLLDEYPEIAENRPEQIAHHFTAAANYETAIDWWIKAGSHALEHSASVEAIEHAKKGLNLLQYVTDTERNRRRELYLQMTLGPVLTATKGYAAPEVENAYRRAYELCQTIGVGADLFPVLWGFYAFSVVRSEFLEALDAATQMLSLADSLNDESMQIESHQALGLINYFMGQPNIANKHIQKVLVLDTKDRDRSFTFKSGQDASVCNLSFAALTCWILGDDKQANDYCKQSIEFARDLEHPFSLAYALNFASWLSYMQNEPEKTRIYAQEEIDISTEHEFFWLHKGKLLLGWAIAQSDDPQKIKEGHSMVKNGFHAYKEPGARLGQTLQIAIDADICLRLGQTDEGLDIIDNGMLAVEQTGEVFWHAELLRLKAEFLKQTEPDKALACYQEAINIAEQQGATGLVQRVQESLNKFNSTPRAVQN